MFFFFYQNSFIDFFVVVQNKLILNMATRPGEVLTPERGVMRVMLREEVEETEGGEFRLPPLTAPEKKMWVTASPPVGRPEEEEEDSDQESSISVRSSGSLVSSERVKRNDGGEGETGRGLRLVSAISAQGRICAILLNISTIAVTCVYRNISWLWAYTLRS